MICNECGAIIPDAELACRACLMRRARDGYLLAQRKYLPTVLSGQLQVGLARQGRSSPFHLVLFDDHLHTYCGAALDGTYKRLYMTYGTAKREKWCIGCLRVFDSLRPKDTPASVVTMPKKDAP